MKKLSNYLVLFTILFSSVFSFTLNPVQAQEETVTETADTADTADTAESTEVVESTQTESQPLNIYLFYGEGCPHCAAEKEFLAEILPEYGDKVTLHTYDIYNSSEANEKKEIMEQTLGKNLRGVPYTIIGDKEIVGFGTAETTGRQIQNRIDECLETYCEDSLSKPLLGIERTKTVDEDSQTNETEEDENGEGELIVDIPFIGPTDLSNTPLLLATIVLGFMDGFNPCAMWVLIFLITLLVNMKDRRKLYTLGIAFIVTSALVYFVFLAAWFNFFKFVEEVKYIKIIIGFVAIYCGITHLRSYLKNDTACHAVGSKQKQTIMDKMRKTVNRRNFLLSLVGIIILAIAVNFIEVVCSAGLPAVFASLLAASNLSTFSHYLYMALYILIFMLDDLAVFFIAIKSFEALKVTEKYNKWSSLVGGIVILIIGILLIFKPSWLMF